MHNRTYAALALKSRCMDHLITEPFQDDVSSSDEGKPKSGLDTMKTKLPE